MYLKGDADRKGEVKDYFGKDVDDDGYVFSLAYKGAAASKPGSWACMVNTMTKLVRLLFPTP